METITSSPIITLQAPESEHYAAWYRSLTVFASSLVSQYNVDGLYGAYNLFIMDEVEAALPAKAVPTVRPPFPADAKAGARDLWKYETAKFDDTIAGLVILKRELLKSLPDSIKDEFEDPLVSFTKVSIRCIIKHVHTKYGKLTAADIATIRARIIEPSNNPNDFQHKIGEMKKDWALLKSANIETCDFDKQCAVNLKFQGCKIIMDYFELYTNKHPEWSSRVFKDLVDHINLLLVNKYVNIKEAGYAPVVQADSKKDSFEEKMLTMMQAMIDSSKSSNQKPKQASNNSKFKYCWFHGFNPTHDGKSCRSMKEGTEYTNEHRIAIGPNIINGVTGSSKVFVPRINQEKK